MANKQLTHTGAELDAAINAVRNNYADTTGTTAAEADVRSGKKFVKANRVLVTGTMPDATLTAELGISGSIIGDEPTEYGITLKPKATIDKAGYVGASVQAETIVKYVKTEKRTYTENGTFRPSASRLLEEVTIAVPQAQLNEPTISINGSDLTITDGNNGTFCEQFLIYVDDVLKSRHPKTGESVIFSLTNIAMSAGSHQIKVACRGTGMVDSTPTASTTYVATAQLATPSAYIISGTTTLAIGIVPNADYYEIFAESSGYSTSTVTTSTTYDLHTGILAGHIGKYEITVVAGSFGTYTRSNPSAPVAYQEGDTLATPTLSRTGAIMTITENDANAERFAIYADGLFRQWIPASGSWTLWLSWSFDSTKAHAQYSLDGGSTWTDINTNTGTDTKTSLRIRLRLIVIDPGYSLVASGGGFSFSQNGHGSYETDEILLNANTNLTINGYNIQ